jgi:ATP-binding cassette subfamily C protein LapB
VNKQKKKSTSIQNYSLIKNLTKVKYSASTFFQLIISTILINIFSLVIPVFFLQVYDRIIPNKSESTLIWLTAGALIMVILEGLIMGIRGIISSKFAYSYIHTSETEFMEKMLSVTNPDNLAYSLPEYRQSMRQLHRLGKFYSGQLFQALMDIPFIVIFLGAIYFIGKEIVIFPISIITIFLFTSLVFKHIFIKRKMVFFKAKKDKNNFVYELFNKIHFIKAQSFEEKLLRKFEYTEQQNSYANFRLTNISNNSNIIGETVSQIIIYGTIIAGGYLVVTGNLTVGVVTACTMLSRRAISPILGISRFLINLSDAQIAVNDINEKFSFISPSRELTTIPYDIKSNIYFNEVTISNNNEPIIENSDISFKENTINCLQMNSIFETDKFCEMLAGLSKPEKGNIFLDNYNVTSIASGKFSYLIGNIPRKGALFNGTILDNITMFNPDLSIQAIETAALTGLDKMITGLPQGFETKLSEKSYNSLPSGMIKRIIISRVFLQRPRIIISNHADIDMDSQTLDDYIDLLKKIKINSTIIIFSENHRLRTICDQHFVLDNGKLINSGVSNG